MAEKGRLEQTAGWLFITATVSSSLGFILLESILDGADVLDSVAANETQTLLGAFLLLVNAIAVVVIPILLYPTLKMHSPHLARLYPGARVVESVVLVIGVVGVLGIVTLSRDHVPTDPDAAGVSASAEALMAVYDWGVLLGIMLFFSLAGCCSLRAVWRHSTSMASGSCRCRSPFKKWSSPYG